MGEVGGKRGARRTATATARVDGHEVLSLSICELYWEQGVVHCTLLQTHVSITQTLYFRVRRQQRVTWEPGGFDNKREMEGME